METLSAALIWINLVMAASCVAHFFWGARFTSAMRPVLIMLGLNCLIMVALYILILCKIELPEITGRINLTLVLLSLNVAGLLLNDRNKL